MGLPLPRMRLYLLLFISVVVLGTLAIMLVEGLSPFNAFYFVIVTLSTVGYGDITPSGAYGRAIIILVIIFGIGTFVAIFADIIYFRDKIREFIALLFCKDHMIICGLHETTEALARQFRCDNTKSVVIGELKGTVGEENIRKSSTVMLSGDPKDPAVLTRARVERARAVLALTDSDGLNAEIALSAMKILEHREGNPLTCILQIMDPRLWRIIREHALSPSRNTAVRIDFYNGPSLSACALIGTYFTHSIQEWTTDPPLLVVVGAGRLGESIIARASREWFENRSSKVLQMILVDIRAEAIRGRLLTTYPRLRDAVNISAISIDVQSPEFQSAGFLKEWKSFSSALVFICLHDDNAGLTAALALSHHLAGMKAQILIRMDHNSGLARLVGEMETGEIRIRPFSSLSIASGRDLVLGGIIEVLARAIHDQYLATLSLHKPLVTNPAMVTWDELPERLRESNRRQAESIMKKLQAVGCDIAPLTDWTASAFTFSPGEVEYLAEMEHERWMDDMKRQGFSFGTLKDMGQKTHPAMVPYAELPEPEKEKDRDAVRTIPRYLSLIDFQVYRR